MTKTIKKLTALLFSATILILLGGCSSTEIIDSPQEPAKKGKTITLSLSAPENASTRADADHQLRYVAKLVEGKLEDVNFKLLERKESLVSKGEKTTITFSVAEGDYTIMLFADYLPSNGITTNEDGGYDDYYYKTRNNTDPKNITVQKYEVNNENLDCFGDVIVVNKTADKVEKIITLKRLVSKVRFISTTPLPNGQSLTSISYSEIPYYTTVTFTDNADIKITQESDKSSGIIETKTLTANQDGEYELFCYYTLANPDSNAKWMKAYSFTLNIENNELKPIPIGQGKVPVIRNTVTTVKGEFLSPKEQTKGDIILNLSTPDEWGKYESTTWQAQ